MLCILWCVIEPVQCCVVMLPILCVAFLTHMAVVACIQSVYNAGTKPLIVIYIRTIVVAAAHPDHNFLPVQEQENL